MTHHTLPPHTHSIPRLPAYLPPPTRGRYIYYVTFTHIPLPVDYVVDFRYATRFYTRASTALPRCYLFILVPRYDLPILI